MKCCACGDEKARVYVAVYGRGRRGLPQSWVCEDCDRGRALTSASPSTPTITGKAPIKFTTVLRAERLAAAGHGWTADEVLRAALDLLESRQAVVGKAGVA